MFTRARHWSLYSARRIQSTTSYPSCLRYILILSSHLSLGPQGGLFPSVFPTKILYTFQSMRATWTAHLILLDFITLITFGEVYKIWSLLITFKHRCGPIHGSQSYISESCEADHSPPSGAEVKNRWNYTSTPTYVFMECCLVKNRYNYIISFFFLACIWFAFDNPLTSEFKIRSLNHEVKLKHRNMTHRLYSTPYNAQKSNSRDTCGLRIVTTELIGKNKTCLQILIKCPE
jgi:hypothetical protein